MKRSIIIFVIAMFIIPVIAFAQAEVIKEYSDFNFSCLVKEGVGYAWPYYKDIPAYYGVDSVLLVWDATRCDMTIINKSGINYQLLVTGKVLIYDETGVTLLGERPYHWSIKWHGFENNTFKKGKEFFPPILKLIG